jgi:dimethylargininase
MHGTRSAAPIAITRDVSPAIGRCELTHLERLPIDLAVARAQHREYERCLEALGCSVRHLPLSTDLPDSVFVEDTAVVFDEVALLTRPGAESRRAELAAVAAELAPYRPIACIEAPGTLDGGDVLVVGRRVFVGTSSRSNAAAIEQMGHLLAPYGYEVQAVAVHGCLHLKSAVTALAENLLLVNPAWVTVAELGDYGVVEVDPAEPSAANALRIGNEIIYPAEFPRTLARLKQRELRVHIVPAGELAKAEGAVTCCSIVFPPHPNGARKHAADHEAS